MTIGFSQHRWDRAYARVVGSSFATVPFYRERWALVGREPVTIREIEKRPDDLAPIGEARRSFDPRRNLTDPLLGYATVMRRCGQRHLDWRRVYARNTASGVAVTLLRQRSPRLVDILMPVDELARVATCPRHGTPVVIT